MRQDPVEHKPTFEELYAEARLMHRQTQSTTTKGSGKRKRTDIASTSRTHANWSRSVHDKADEKNSKDGLVDGIFEVGQPMEEGEFEADESDDEQMEEKKKFDEEAGEGEEEHNEGQPPNVDVGDERTGDE
ncbi:hypothetical protein Syun_004013 [Stephania yunnanensis]|uniref:Uncharacterized protein n=1 Tax=Stephania yunnanensis TaxID=152371 RepID=A0AAP0L2I3_9MAGN